MSHITMTPPSACRDPAPAGRFPRWAVWRSPPGQPWWARPALLCIAATAAVLYAWNLPLVDYAPRYSDAVKSMSENWKAFLYGTVDVQATYTLDKLAGAFVPQAISVKIFGFHAWALALPQVIEGVISVLVMYRIVRRWAGVVPGLLAAAVFTITPVAASMFGHSMADGALVMCLVLAVDSYQRAVLEGRLRSLVWAGVWVGLGFQAKMLQAWMILPALAIGYLLSAPIGLRRRLQHLGIAGVVTLVVSLSWITLYHVTPAADRPYISGTTNSSAAAMVFGYNGLGRLGINLPGALPPNYMGSVIGPAPPKRSTQLPRPRPGMVIPEIGIEHGGGWGKLFGGRLGVASGWLYPLALMALLCGLWWWRRAERTDPARGGMVMWGVWLLTFALPYSAVFVIPHSAYVAVLAPPVAALSGIGIVMFWRAYRSGGRMAWIFPLAIVAELAWAVWLWSFYPTFLPWAMWGAVALGVVAVVALALARLVRPRRSSLVSAGLTIGVAAMLAAPATWSASVLDPRYGGSSFDANAGPAARTPGG
ncbi:ArnT family glycosyltransferase [Nonomuraea gerenzanensis]|uniref:Putative mannosyltransferase n=1 Tax=Nonomuraea gerenzanensis TaxID=93944 RepID=Q7WZ71_9ACTN|nr:glycosyltransferase family 39 protein [Nonomuraea gerenzanensis]UBU14931.1 glycosyltransferase family 39 protein [Nonomuraea gerenzanensis]CAD91215.1 putative mannosyltransferase [Nonomuraea gerenzanensis]